jgi:putative tricarboxylic transport membrane protein
MNKERIGSLFFLFAGLFALFHSLKYPIGSLTLPGPGMFPLILSILLCILGILIFISGRGKERFDWRIPIKQFARPLEIFILTVGFILAFEPLGFLLTSFLYLFGLFLWVCRFKLWVALMWAIVLMPASFIFFGKILGLLLPMGPLRF